jgi:hypothetical protein
VAAGAGWIATCGAAACAAASAASAMLTWYIIDTPRCCDSLPEHEREGSLRASC